MECRDPHARAESRPAAVEAAASRRYGSHDDVVDLIGEPLGITHPRRGDRWRHDRSVHDELDIPRLRAETALLHDVARSNDSKRNDRQSGFERKQKAAGLEPPDRAVPAPRPLGEDNQREPVLHERAPPVEDANVVGVLAIDEQMPAAAKVPSKHREPRQRCLRDDPQLVRQRREDDRNVINALVIRDEHVRRAGSDSLEALHAHADPGRLQDEPRPGARTSVREVTAPIEQARHDGRRAENDGVHADGGDQVKDRPPPVKGRDTPHGVEANYVC